MRHCFERTNYDIKVQNFFQMHLLYRHSFKTALSCTSPKSLRALGNIKVNQRKMCHYHKVHLYLVCKGSQSRRI